MESVACLTKNALTDQFGYPLFAAKQVAATINELESSHFEWTINWKGAKFLTFISHKGYVTLI